MRTSQIHRQYSNIINLLFFNKECRLKLIIFFVENNIGDKELDLAARE
jgi:hypothetical protein